MSDVASSGFLVVAPVFNEEALIGEFLRRVAALAASLPIVGVVIVDDGSADKTSEIILQHAARAVIPVELVRLSRNFGHQNAILAGLQHAHEWAQHEGIPFIGLLDADLQDQPEHFEQLFACSEDADVIYAVRASRGEGFVMRRLSNAFHWVLSRISRFPIPRGAGTFSLMRTTIVQVILRNADPDPYFPGIRAWVGYRQVGVPIPRAARVAGNSKVGFRGLFRLAVRAVFAYSNLPQTIFVWISVLTLLLSMVAILVIVALRVLGYLSDVPGVATIIIAIFLSLGIQSIYLTLVTYMISRLGQQRPKEPFVIGDVVITKTREHGS